MMRTKNSTLDVLKGLAIFLVIYGHLIQRILVLDGQDFFVHPVFKIIYTFHMPLFFFISGCLLAVSLSRKDILGVFLARCKSLMIPYFTWGTLGVVTFYILAKIDGSPARLDFLQSWFQQMIINPEIWFLVSLFLCSVVLLASLKLRERYGGIVFFVSYLLLLMMPYHQYGALYYVKWFYPFYFAGFWFNRSGWALSKAMNLKAVFIICFLLFLTFAYFWSRSDYIYVNKMNFLTTDYFLEFGRFVYRYSVGFMGNIVIFFIGAAIVKTPVARFFEWAGVYSLDIYLIQRYLAEGLFPRIVFKAGLEFNTYSPFFLLVVAPAITLLILLFCIVISKHLIRNYCLTKFLFLGRSS